ncbi:hypothetical protein PMIN01_00035 [Paraphaeosphaeria minitans]|uniref:Uncharacterized protein n=1 Tax=Paraphaeosphaeria minitans TaxID=565426 RepID=A0A9P6GRH2_9PLEO|nr:hypothetical protein PMIN01_00035 [Paraphaeosphaeria minitans]
MGWKLGGSKYSPDSLMESIKILEEMKVRNAARLSEGVGPLAPGYFRPTRPFVRFSPQRPATAAQQSAIPTSSRQMRVPEPLNIPQLSAQKSLPHTLGPLLHQLPGQQPIADASEAGLIPSPYTQHYTSQSQQIPGSALQPSQRSILPMPAHRSVLYELLFESAPSPAVRTPGSLSPPVTAILRKASPWTAGDSPAEPSQWDCARTRTRPRSQFSTLPLPSMRRRRLRTPSDPPPPLSRCTCGDDCTCPPPPTERQLGPRCGDVNSPWYKSLFGQASQPPAPRIQISPPSPRSAGPRPESANAVPAEQQPELLSPHAARRTRPPDGTASSDKSE